MAITGNVRAESSQGGNAKKMYGISSYEILGVNLSNAELKELGFYVKEGDETKEREFVTEKDGVASVQIEFACRSMYEDRRLRKFSFWIENKNARNKEENPRALYKFINDQGLVAWSLRPDEFVGLSEVFNPIFTGPDEELNPRPAKKGEEEFMLFMRACMAINFRDGGTIKYNLKKFFNNSFKELQEDLNSDYLTPVVVATIIQIKQTDEGIKEIESFYRYAFAPGKDYKLLLGKKEYTEEDAALIRRNIKENKGKKGKARVWITPLEELIAKMTDPEYPCKDVFHLGLPIEYVSEGHIQTSDSPVIQEDDYEADDSKY